MIYVRVMQCLNWLYIDRMLKDASYNSMMFFAYHVEAYKTSYH